MALERNKNKFWHDGMDSIHLIRENLERSEAIALSRIEEMRDHCMTPPCTVGGCHTLWILGHLAYIEGLVICHFMLGNVNPLADWKDMFDEADISSDINQFVPFDRALSECRAIRSSTLSLLESYNEQRLNQTSAKSPDGAEDLFGTHRRCFQYCADHWLMHRGQLADSRCAAGKERMWY